jgi:hypothetical protein
VTQRLIHAALARTAFAVLVLVAGCSGSKSPGLRDNDGGGDLEGDAEAISIDEDGSTQEPDEYGDASTGPTACVPRTCAAAGANCGPIADGCGGLLECGKCTEPGTICGGGGTPSVCGGGFGNCKPRTCAEAGVNCGPIGDGCGKLIECGSCTTPGESCGGAGVHSQCGGAIDNPQTCAGQVTCADLGAECGDVGNGCGGIIHCGNPCVGNDICGGGGVHNKCGGPTCTPRTCAGVDPSQCGPISDGCGGLLTSCGTTCTSPDTCGGGGMRDRCGNGTTACQPLGRDAACAGARCGPTSDGCGGQVDCGGCASGQSCGGGTTPGVCGAPACVPATCDQLNLHCGTAPDGCGNTLQCGGCPSGQSCGGSGAPGQCGAPTCSPRSCEQQGIKCGPAGDGCGGRIDSCGPCPTGQSCGGSGVLNQCGAPPACVPTATSCAALGWACGIAIDNCGNTYDCAVEGRTCSGLEVCTGGIGGPTRCVGVGQGSCPLCSAVPACTGATQTTQLSGRVITPGRTDQDSANQVGVPNAFVYILRANDAALLPAIPAGIPPGGTSCDRCADQDLGPVLSSALTDAQGNYVLRANIPVGTPFQLVVKVGKFRRAVTYTVPPSGACKTTAVPALSTRLPRARADGAGVNLPKIAVSTGQIDAMECVFEKLGIEHSEFANPGANGGNAQRIHLYRGGVNAQTAAGARIDDNTPFDSALYGTLTRMLGYDMIVADCEGQSWDGNQNFTQRDSSGANVREFVNRGGRMFISHLSMSWLHGNGALAYAAGTFANTGLADVASWDTDYRGSGNLDGDGTGVISIVGNRPRASPRIANFAAWMVREGVPSTPDYTFPTFPITDPRSLATGIGTSSEEFVYRSDGNERVQQFSFNSPYAAPLAASCGRVAYSGFHVAATNGGTAPFQSSIFPNHCSGNLTDQEKVLLYMLFDLGACVGNEPVPPACTPTTCQAQGAQCGVIGNGCGGSLRCDSCGAGQQCLNNQCVGTCQRRTCEQAQANCGPVSDGCGGTLECGLCPGGQTCGGGGTPNQCSVTECKPRSCASVSAGCGLLADGCGKVVECGDCPAGKICGAGGHPNQCGVGECPPRTCASEQAQCGFIGDGCGGAVNCGPCLDGQSCGAGGVPNQCGAQCEPLTCQALNAQCGFVGTGCGGSVDCGTCPRGQTCGAGGPNRCGGGCNPLTCQAVAAECGFIGDGCGNAINCGVCPPGKICGAGGMPNKCGDGPGCKPDSCASVGAGCGLIGDGCGSSVDCGPCPEGQTCGGGGTPNQCGGTCKKLTCADHHANCGQASDGCGGLVDCGVCAPPYTCGTGDMPNQCAGVVLE